MLNVSEYFTVPTIPFNAPSSSNTMKDSSGTGKGDFNPLEAAGTKPNLGQYSACPMTTTTLYPKREHSFYPPV